MQSEARVEITNEAGLHARPCHAVVGLALEHSAELRVRCGEREVNGKSILALMTLEASQGAVLHVQATGDDAQALVQALVTLIEGGFDETH